MELKTFLKPLLKWWWLIVIAAILAGASSYFVVRNDPPIYQSRTSLVVGRPLESLNPSGSEFYLSQQLAETYAVFARRELVREATQTALGLDWLPEYTVGVPPLTQLLEIMVTDTDPQRAQIVADELANQLILLSPSGLDLDEQKRQDFLNGQLVQLEQQIQATQDEILILQTNLGELFSASEIADSQSQIEALQAKLNTLQANYAGFLVSTQEEAVNVLTVIEPAYLPTVPVGPNSKLTILIAVAFGIVLATGTAYLLEYLDDSLRSPEEAVEAIGLPALATLNRARFGADNNSLVAIDQPRAPISEAFRDLRTNVQFLGLESPSRTLLVTSSNPSEGKSFTISNLGIVMAQAGFKTIIVDADLRRPKQYQNFELANSRGLSDLVLAVNPLSVPDRQEDNQAIEALLEARVQPTTLDKLFVLTSGPIPPNPSELIGSNGMKLVLATLQEQYDYVLIDSSPTLAVTDPMILATLVDNVLLVMYAGRTRRKDLIKMKDRLEGVKANVQGIIVNQVASVGRGYYYNYYGKDEPSGSDSPLESKGRPKSGNSIRQRVNRLANTFRTFLLNLVQPGKS